MAGRFEFRSSGAAFNRSLQETLVKQELTRRQQLLDGIALENTLRQRAREEAAAERAATLARQQDADRLAGIVGPSADLTPDQAGTLRAGGYQISEQATLPARTIPMPVTTAPIDPRQAAVQRGQDIRAAMGYAPKIAAQELPSTSYARRQETYAEQLAREQREAAQAEKDEQRRFRDEQAAADRTFRGEQAEANRAATAERSAADRDLKLMIAQMSASTNMETRALGNELKRLQIQAEQDKQDAARIDRERAERTRVQGRAEVRDLAMSLINDPALASITGPIEGRRDTFIQSANVDALAKLTQLTNMLSLEGRSKLKGSGQISDFESRMLAQASTALNRAAGPEAVKRHLQAIVSVFTDDAPGGSGNGPRIGRFEVVGVK